LNKAITNPFKDEGILFIAFRNALVGTVPWLLAQWCGVYCSLCHRI